MQALVEHCVAEGRPEAVERCVLKMDLLSLDLNQARGAFLCCALCAVRCVLKVDCRALA